MSMFSFDGTHVAARDGTMTPTGFQTSHLLGVSTLSGKPLSVPTIATCSSPLAPPS